MSLTGQSFIAGERITGTEIAVYGLNPTTDQVLEPAYHGVTEAEVDRAAMSADRAFAVLSAFSREDRAEFLETIADNIMSLGDELVDRVIAETGLPRVRVEGERGRTVGQLRLFAELVRSGNHERIQYTSADVTRKPLPRSDIRLRYVGLGPVAVFGASNFPLAFSVAGGDTAAAFAAGCPVIVKAHSAHPGTSELVAGAIQQAVDSLGLPPGTFSLVYGSGNQVGSALVAHPAIKAVGFTGSRAGGLALMKIANSRDEPIPVYAEMSSQNPVVILSGSMAANSESLAAGFVASLTQGAGQFCTNPGLVIIDDSEAGDEWLRLVRERIHDSAAQTMLTPGIFGAYSRGVDQLERLVEQGVITKIAQGQSATGPNQARAYVFEADAGTFLSTRELHDEVFGPTSIVVHCANRAEIVQVINSLEGQLTGTVQATEADSEFARQLISVLERKVGRIVFNGWPTGVEVCEAICHGGPFPATSDGRSTSVGTEAITRFQRPVAYQDFPLDLLPSTIREI